MARRVLPIAAGAALLLSLAGCGLIPHAERPAWRGQAENSCLAQGRVTASAYAQPAHPIEGPGICGLDHPFKVTALAGGSVRLNAPQTIGCPLTAALDEWVANVVQPIAMARFGQPVAQINSMGSFSCRSIDNIRGAKLSEHSFGNAIDIGGFTLADGHSIVVVKAWTRGDPQEQAFLREAQAGACNIFTTVLAPGADMFHYNHIHLDLAMHGQTSTGPRRYCKPRPSPQLTPAPGPGDGLPDPPDIDEDMDVSSAAPARGGYAGAIQMAAPAAPIGRAPARQAYAPPAGFSPPAGLAPPASIDAAPRSPAHYDANGTYWPAGEADATSTIPGARR